MTYTEENKKKALLIFEFLKDDNSNLVESIEIQNEKIPIDLSHKDKYEFILYDKIEFEYKVFECKFNFKTRECSLYSITVYFNSSINYYLCGKGNNSNFVEIIFSDFFSKNIEEKDCKILYNKTIYSPSENYKLLTRKRINFLNIDLKKLQLPKAINGEKIALDEKIISKNSIQIYISVAHNIQKTIGIFKNQSNQKEITIPNASITNLLEETIKNVNNILNYKSEYSFKEYKANINNNEMKELSKIIKESENLEKKISPFFMYYRENPTEEELHIFELFSEFMIMFPSLKGYPRNTENPYVYKYICQYFYSKKSIENFSKSIPDTIPKKDRIFLLFSACSCLRLLLINGYGELQDDLFYFLNYSEKDTIYYDAINHNTEFVNLLEEESEMFLPFLEINSGSSFELLSSKLSARMSLLDASAVKAHLLSTIPTYGIRINCNSHFNAVTLLETRITCVSEIKLFGKFFQSIDNKIDPSYQFRFRLSTLLKHEHFGHVKFSLNFLLYNETKDNANNKIYEPISPIRYYKVYKNEDNVEVTLAFKISKYEFEEKGESGKAVEYFLTRGDPKLMQVLKKLNTFSEDLFLHPEYMAAKSLDKFIEILKKDEEYLQDSIENLDKEGKFSLNEECDGIVFGFPRREKY